MIPFCPGKDSIGPPRAGWSRIIEPISPLLRGELAVRTPGTTNRPHGGCWSATGTVQRYVFYAPMPAMYQVNTCQRLMDMTERVAGAGMREQAG